MSKLSLAFGALAFGFLGLAAWHYVADRELPGPPLIIDNPDRDLGQVRCKAPVAVRYLLKNNSRQPIQVFGLNPG